ncbi:cytochrome P450 3A13 [Annulohypoxylon truncatum]|uniref:cytochrome P450 3A13 n=1 Tax=Annulohypoxylon truncatum TaxID=327061 RepID=UPI002007AC50|nr:cytochrome P450 3A13 [Annulohypoxylon truncatum]KAI1213085.1 cytochrome P450 3A13 [Annulohypoxylon truncatum]
MLILNPFLLGPAFLALLGLYVWRSIASPLRKVPGPRISLFTSWVLKYHEFHAHRTTYVHSLHQKYGPVVRIAPNEVSFASLEGVKEIYGSGGSGYNKTEFYDLFTVYGRRTMFSTLNKEDHAKRKRVLADRYANTNILKSGSIDGIKERSRRFIERCSKSIGGSCDIFICLHDYAFDCVTHHLFHPYGSDSLRNLKDEEIMKQVTFDDSLQNRLIRYYNPSLHKIIGNVLSLFAKPRETPLADDLVMSATAKTGPAQFTLLSRMQDKNYNMEHIDMAAESLDHMAAGIDTTGDALCFLMWEISQPRSFYVQRRLQEELLANPDAGFDKLPFLDAVISEGLRCFPAIPMSLPRYVPSGGRTIDGYYVPEGAIVSCQAYSAHRIDENVFPQPGTFDPDRWLQEAGELDRKRLFFAFASGGRGCIGKHLALAEMKILLRDVYSRFTTVPDPTMTASDMEMSDQLISAQPRGKKCLLRLIPLEG